MTGFIILNPSRCKKSLQTILIKTQIKGIITRNKQSARTVVPLRRDYSLKFEARSGVIYSPEFEARSAVPLWGIIRRRGDQKVLAWLLF